VQPIFIDLDIEWQRVRDEADLLAQAVQRYRNDPAMRADRIGRWMGVSAIASGVEKVYSGTERMMKLIASGIDGAVPNDEAWHRTLLLRMGVSLPDVRPPVLSATTVTCLDRLRSFRHRERNSYAADLDEERVLAVADTLPDALAVFRADLDAFRHAMDTAPPA
jgi:hypothetical protein